MKSSSYGDFEEQFITFDDISQTTITKDLRRGNTIKLEI